MNYSTFQEDDDMLQSAALSAVTSQANFLHFDSLQGWHWIDVGDAAGMVESRHDYYCSSKEGAVAA